MNIKIEFNKENCLQVAIPYDTDVINAVKKVPGRRWDPKERVWLFLRTALKPKDVRPEDINLYLERINSVAGCSRSYAVQCIRALKCFYRHGLNQPYNPAETIPLPKKERHYPDILSREEVRRIISGTDNIKHRLRDGKGHKDRFVMLSEAAESAFERYRNRVYIRDWLFPGAKEGSHLSVRTAQAVFLSCV